MHLFIIYGQSYGGVKFEEPIHSEGIILNGLDFQYVGLIVEFQLNTY